MDRILLLLAQLGLLLLVAVALGRFAARCGLPALVGELCAGVVLGPSLFGALAPGARAAVFPADAGQVLLLDAVGTVGVLLLVAIGGMELDVGRVRRNARAAAWISAAGCAVPLALGVAAGPLLPAALMGPADDRTGFALFLGVAMCVSAIPVIARTLIDLDLLHRRVGGLTLTAAVIDDTVGWTLLAVVAAITTTGTGAAAVGTSLLGVGAVVLFCATAGRPLVAAALRPAGGPDRPARARSQVAVVAIVLAGAAATRAMGLEAILGAFAAGLLVGAVPGAREAVAPLRAVVLAVLAPVFFATAGLRIDLTALVDPAVPAAALAVVALAVVGKFAGAWAGARAGGIRGWEAFAIGAGMNARGVIEVVVATVGVRLGVLSAAGYTVIVLVAVVTSVMAPPLLRFAMRRADEGAAAAAA